MSDDPHSRGGPPTYVQPGAAAPSHAERVRTLVEAGRDGALSTLALEPAGSPFGSIVTYATDGDGAPLLLMSTMAEHARNLAADPRAALLVTAGGEGAGRLAAARATLVGRVAPVPAGGAEAALDAYLAAHPDAFWARFPDFGVHRLDVEAIRYVRGFGEMSWVDAAGYAAAQADPVAEREAGIVEHMNDDHADALREIAVAALPLPAEPHEVRMLSCDRYGFEVQLRLAGAGDAAGEGATTAFGRIAFPDPLQHADEARTAMVALVRDARALRP